MDCLILIAGEDIILTENIGISIRITYLPLYTLRACYVGCIHDDLYKCA
jgi:hypothetical protein